MDKIKVRTLKKGGKKDSTDISLMVESHSHEEICDYDESKIRDALVRELGFTESEADVVSSTVSERIKKSMSESLSKTIDTALIRSFVNVVLYEKGITKQLLPASDIVISAYDVKQIIESASKENGNMVHNPESINFTLAERIIKEYTMKHLLDSDVSRAHMAGEIHVHDIGSFTRAYCSGHSIEYLKVNGIKNIPNIPSTSSPAKHADTLARHLCSITQFLSSIFAGAIGWEALNVFFAPYIVDFPYPKLVQLAQTILFDLSQMAGAKGGQVSFTDFNLYITVPEHYRETYAIHPGGYYKGFDRSGTNPIAEGRFYSLEEAEAWEKADPETHIIVKYKDYEKEAQKFLSAIFEVACEGDSVHLPFSFPKLNLHINEDTFTKYKVSFVHTLDNGLKYELYEGISGKKLEVGCKTIYCHREDIDHYTEQGYVFKREDNTEALSLLDQACQVASVNGGIYFLFDRNKFSMAQCCRLKVKLDEKDNTITRDPGQLRFVGLQNVSINLPNAALVAKTATVAEGQDRFEIFISEIRKRIWYAVKAHLTRKRYLSYLMGLENSPLKYYTEGMDGKPYVDLEKASYLIGVVGLNECIYNLTGHEMHESDATYALGLEIILRMYDMCHEIGKESGLGLKLEETPAESTAMRFATIDRQKYGELAFVKENEYGIYYTNSVHFSYDCDMSFMERLIKQSRFHPLFEAGSITHAWVGDRLPDPMAAREVVASTWYKTECEQFTFSPDLTSCYKKGCKTTVPGFREVCPKCGDDRFLSWTTRVTGYLITVDKFNRGKRAELKDRNRDAHTIKPVHKEMEVKPNVTGNDIQPARLS